MRRWRQSDGVLARLLARTTIDPATGCWVWTGGMSGGYGKVRVTSGPGGVVDRVHRVGYTLLVGPIRPGLTIDHLCRNTACWSPDHLQQVERGENTRRRNTARAIECGLSGQPYLSRRIAA